MPALPDDIRQAARGAGLTALWVVPRAAIDAAFAAHTARPTSPVRLHPGYRSVVVLASAGPAFWRHLRTAQPQGRVPDPAGDPLDRHTEHVVEALAKAFRRHDPTVVTAYPFRHPRQVLGFRHLLGAAPFLDAPTPFGVTVAPELGPWWALRGALLTALDLPPDPPLGDSPCTACPAPCVAACPAGAVHREGLDWPACADFRLSGPTCAVGCQARLACPVAPHLRYDDEAIAHHGTASLRELRALRGDAGPSHPDRQ